MNNVQILINKAQELKQNGNLHAALACYHNVFDMLIKDADTHARAQDGSIVDVGKVRAITSKLFAESKNFLKRDKTAAVVSNNMGVIYVRLGDFESAKVCFDQAIELTPDDEVYSDPIKNLKNIAVE